MLAMAMCPPVTHPHLDGVVVTTCGDAVAIWGEVDCQHLLDVALK